MNFAFRLDEAGDWRLSPAFDLTWNAGPGGEHTMTVAGEGKTPSRNHLSKLAAAAAIPPTEVARVIDQVASAANAWPNVARDLGVGSAIRTEIAARIRQNVARLRA